MCGLDFKARKLLRKIIHEFRWDMKRAGTRETEVGWRKRKTFKGSE
jgi:hypothetical protein